MWLCADGNLGGLFFLEGGGVQFGGSIRLFDNLGWSSMCYNFSFLPKLSRTDQNISVGFGCESVLQIERFASTSSLSFFDGQVWSWMQGQSWWISSSPATPSWRLSSQHSLSNHACVFSPQNACSMFRSSPMWSFQVFFFVNMSVLYVILIVVMMMREWEVYLSIVDHIRPGNK